MTHQRHILECKNISYMTAISSGTNWFSKIYKPPSVFQILKNVSFTATSGEIHVIVGVSDSGKTILLESLTSGAGGDIGGIAMLDKFMLTKSRFKKYCSFANFKTDFPLSQTVRNFLFFHASLHLSSTLSSIEINHRINELMGLFDILGYSHERLEYLTISALRRVLTVLEILKDPIVVLIDDPILNLSPLSSYQLIYALQYYSAKYNRIVIITLRSIRSDLLHLIGSITFLFYGEVAYSGTINQMPNYFQKLGYDCPINENPIAYYLSLLTIDKESIENIAETQQIAANLIKSYLETKKTNKSNNSCSNSGSSNTLLASVLCSKNVSSVNAIPIIIRRILNLLISSPTSSLLSFVLLPITAIFFSFFYNQKPPSSLFFWKIMTFLFLSLQSITIFPIYSKLRYFSIKEINIYSTATNLFAFSIYFIIFSFLQSFLFTGIIMWSTNFEYWIDISIVLFLLSFFSFSIFSLSVRYLKDFSNIFLIYSTIILFFFLIGNGVTRISTSSNLTNYALKISPFTYSNFIFSFNFTKQISEDSVCYYPRYICSMITSLHSDLYPSSTYFPINLLGNFILLATSSLTFFAFSLLIHIFEPSIQLQKHILYKNF